MKYNEPIRPSGIGKKQVAFNTGDYPTAYSVYGQTEYDENATRLEELSYSMLAKAKASAEATATSLKQDVQNISFEIAGIYSTFMSSGVTGVDVPWNASRVLAWNPLYYYNWYDRYLYVRKPGWYFVKVFLFAPAVNAAHEWGIKLISNVSVGPSQYEAYNTYMDYQHTSKHPYVNGTALFNAPEQAFVQNGGGMAGFKIRLYSTTSNINFDQSTTYAGMQVIRLSDLNETNRLLLPNV
jgi:hypothetical protein